MIVTRFAPSPTGPLHRGHAYAALFAHQAAQGGRFLLRIEDIDAARSRQAFEGEIELDLRWLGLDWERPVRRQSEHLADYRAALDRLSEEGLVYPCFCTRRTVAAEIAAAGAAPHGHGTIYPGTCRTLSVEERKQRIGEGAPYALRFNSGMAARRAGPLTFTDGARETIAVDAEVMGDAVIARKDVPASYQLAVVVDDAAQGVTLVTRGVDLFEATHLQRLLQVALGLPEPRYHHHRLILNEAGERLSKRDGAQALAALRAAGVTPADVRAQLGFKER
ncbi:MAG TPA: tRNA glutamyl-Q(34) synthetase GluQRS [Alphaproteobacteria bacterium]|jgi:glutamyl-Q tRNA(Asp) synthetase|nr:tRNA glutamyl-Q(34) synthetase GluQRS [Alphaproteobacteria bacterium]